MLATLAVAALRSARHEVGCDFQASPLAALALALAARWRSRGVAKFSSASSPGLPPLRFIKNPGRTRPYETCTWHRTVGARRRPYGGPFRGQMVGARRACQKRGSRWNLISCDFPRFDPFASEASAYSIPRATASGSWDSRRFSPHSRTELDGPCGDPLKNTDKRNLSN